MSSSSARAASAARPSPIWRRQASARCASSIPTRSPLSNLQRQILFGTDDIGQPKAETARKAAARINPDCHLIPINQRLTADNAAVLLRHADVILDGCDNFETRLAVSDAATALRTPLVTAAVGQFEGQLGVWRGWETDQPCYRCLVGSDPGMAGQTCAEDGIVGALTGIIGSMAALEAIAPSCRSATIRRAGCASPT